MVALGPWHGWLLLATAATPDPDHGDPYAWIKAIERDGGAHTLPAGTLEIDRQYILQAGTTIVGAVRHPPPPAPLPFAQPAPRPLASPVRIVAESHDLHRPG